MSSLEAMNAGSASALALAQDGAPSTYAIAVRVLSLERHNRSCFRVVLHTRDVHQRLFLGVFLFFFN